MTLYGFGITSQMIPSPYWDYGYVYHIGLEVLYIIGFLVEWKDGSVDWVPLKELKKSNPVDLAEYTVVNEISDEPAFNW